MVTFVYNSDIAGYKRAFYAKPFEVKAFTVFALIVSCGSMLLLACFSRWFQSTISPLTGWIGLWLYINPVIITLFNKQQRKGRSINMAIITFLVIFIFFGTYDLHPDQFELHTTISGLRVNPYRYIFTMVMPAIWIVILAIRPISVFVQLRKLKSEGFIPS